MKISDKGLNLIKKFEGCRLTAYQDAVGVWTIGYGTTNADKAITGTTSCQGLKISQATADDWFPSLGFSTITFGSNKIPLLL